MHWGSIARRIVPRPLRAAANWKLRHSFRFKRARNSSIDYLAEFDHSSLRRAKASILWFDDWKTATARQLGILSSLGLIRNTFTIVDYGCGIGRMSQAIAEEYAVRLLAVDRSAEMLRHARNYVSNAFVTNGTIQLFSEAELMTCLPSLAQSVDAILFMEVLQHIPEPIIDRLLPLLIGTLKPSGKVFVFGNVRIDVGADGRLTPETPTVETVLERHVRIERRDVWVEGFAVPRFSFVCAA